MRLLHWIGASLAVAMLAFSVPAQAQQAEAQRPVVRSPILTIESERLFADSAFGQRVVADIEADGLALAAENRALEAELTAEEQRLTDLRAQADNAEFREMADAFDARVQDLRQQQDAKARALATRDDAARRSFFSAAQPVLAEILREAGAALILERANVLLSANAIDITDLAIARVNAQIGDGSDLPAPAPEPTSEPAEDASAGGPAEEAPDATTDPARDGQGTGGGLFDMGNPTGSDADPDR